MPSPPDNTIHQQLHALGFNADEREAIIADADALGVDPVAMGRWIAERVRDGWILETKPLTTSAEPCILDAQERSRED